MTIVDYDSPKLEGFNVIVPLRSESGDLYSLVLDLSENGYGAKKLAMNVIASAQVWHRWLGHFHVQSLIFYTSKTALVSHFEEVVSDCDVCAVGKVKQLAHPKKANHKVSQPFQLCYGDLIEPFTPAVMGGYKYISKVLDEYAKWTAVYLLTNNNQALQSLQMFLGLTVIPFGARIVS